MATSFVGPLFVDNAFSAAPVPRPPQPTRARRMVLSSAAYTCCGIAIPAKALAAASRPAPSRTSRRERPVDLISLTEALFLARRFRGFYGWAFRFGSRGYPSPRVRTARHNRDAGRRFQG